MLLQSSLNKWLLIFIAVLLLSAIGYGVYTLFPSQRTESQVFVERYPYAAIENIWISYKKSNIQNDGRTVDKSLNYLTTSEGQSYSMLRAVWVDDKETFDKVFVWTKNNLQKRDDSLLSWQWGQREDGSWGVLDNGGENTASDADLDIALALILANKRWNQDHYLSEATRILNDVWEKEILTIEGRPYLVAGNWAIEEEKPTVNPSYFNFAAYNIFAEVDPVHDWMALKDTSYEVLNASTDKLPSDWVQLNRETGQVEQITLEGKSSNFGDDAVRIPWRVGLDWFWNRDQRALDYLNKLNFLNDEWKLRGAIFKTYTTDGQALTNEESLSTYGATLPYFSLIHPLTADEIYSEKLINYYNPDTFDFATDVGYYSKNWAWFGMAFYESELTNIYQVRKEGRI